MSRYSMKVEWSAGDEVFIASCPELGGLATHGPTQGAAVTELATAIDLALEAYQADGWMAPEPQAARPFSGQFRVRLPSSLHRWLSDEAEREGVSLNTCVVSKLAEARGALSLTRAE